MLLRVRLFCVRVNFLWVVLKLRYLEEGARGYTTGGHAQTLQRAAYLLTRTEALEAALAYRLRQRRRA